MTGAGEDLYRDTPVRYGRVSRTFHWIMAYLLIWQMLMFIGWRVLSADVMRGIAHFGPSHSLAGTLILLLIVPRAIWALVSRRRRPPAPVGSLGWAASTGHAMLYVLMFIIPAVAVLRAYGSGKGLAFGAVRVLPPSGREITTMVQPADLAHAPLGWILAVLVGGHIAMALFHHFIGRDGTLTRMVGRPTRPD
jgi:cytochrome b561